MARSLLRRFYPAVMCGALALGLIACDDFPTPAELDHVQMVALRAEPVAVPAGGRARLDALFLGPTGEVVPDSALWETVAERNLPAIGRIEVDSTGTYLVAPDTVAMPTLAAVQLFASSGDFSMTGKKGVGVGAPFPIGNPALDRLEIDGVPVTGSGPISVALSALVTLSAGLTPQSENDQFAWYTTAGAIERYRSADTELTVAPELPPESWLFVVGRDGKGGIAWRSVRVLPL